MSLASTASPSQGSPAAARAAVTIKEREFKLIPSTVKLKRAGTVTFHAQNAGRVGHSLEIEGNGVEKRIAGTIAPGRTKSLTVRLKRGTYAMYCPIGNHRAMGMKGTVTVGGTGY